MKAPRRRIEKNYPLRQELIEKGFVIPYHGIPAWLSGKGYEAASLAAAERRR